MVTAELRDAAWSIAEELVAAQYFVEAAATLEGLVSLYVASSFSSSDPTEVITTRLRAAEILLGECSGGVTMDPILVLLEPAVSGAHSADPRVPANLRFSCHRLYGVAQRRRQKFASALASFRTASQYMDVSDQEKVEALTLEVARVHYAKCVNAAFSDAAVLAALRDVTQPPSRAIVAATGRLTTAGPSLAMLHAITLSCSHQPQEALVVLSALEAALPRDDASLRHSVAGLASLISFAAGLPRRAAALPSVPSGLSNTPTPAASSSSQQQNEWGDHHHHALILSYLHDVLFAAAGGRAKDAAASFERFSAAADQRLREINTLNAGAGRVTAAANAELRFLAGAKISAFYDLALLDMCAADFTAAAAKMDSIASYMTVFVRHAVHFRGPFHAAAACLAMMLGHLDAAAEHVAVLGEIAQHSPESDEAALAFLVGCAVAYARAEPSGEFAALVDEAVLGGAHSAMLPLIQRSPRYSVMWGLLHGRRLLAQGDHARAVAALKTAGNTTREVFGVQCPLLATTLAALAEAHASAGNAVAAEGSITMASQIARVSGDEYTLSQCTIWALMRTASTSAPLPHDVTRRTQLSGDASTSVARFHSAVDAAARCDAALRVFGFTPFSSESYRHWIGKMNR